MSLPSSNPDKAFVKVRHLSSGAGGEQVQVTGLPSASRPCALAVSDAGAEVVQKADTRRYAL
jgi:hypothetical protein